MKNRYLKHLTKLGNHFNATQKGCTESERRAQEPSRYLLIAKFNVQWKGTLYEHSQQQQSSNQKRKLENKQLDYTKCAYEEYHW